MATKESRAYLSHLSKSVSSIGRSLDSSLLAEGCTSYVKTIYIGYEIDGEMVAALYGRPDHIELALALAEDDPNRTLKDATYLTWRTLPVAVDVRTADEAAAAQDLIRRACERVRSKSHDVHRDNEHFVRSRQERRSRMDEESS